jgi:putative lipase involved disintegration of autophagic bodies
MPNAQPYVQNYLKSAQDVYFAYKTNIQVGQTSTALQTAMIDDDDNIRTEVFRNAAEMKAFTDTNTVIATLHRGGALQSGLDIVVFKDTSGNISFNVAGVGPTTPNAVSDTINTAGSTLLEGFNTQQFAEARTLLRSIILANPTSAIQLNGHSAGGPIVQLLAADMQRSGNISHLDGVATFGSYGINFAAIYSPFSDSFVPDFKQLLTELSGMEKSGVTRGYQGLR